MSLGGASRGNLVVLATLKRMVLDEEGCVREASIKSFAKVSPAGDEVSFYFLMSIL